MVFKSPGGTCRWAVAAAVAVAQEIPLASPRAAQWCPGSRGDIAATLGRHPGIVLDVGAFDGSDAVAFAAAGDHEVYSFEPTPSKAARIKDAIAASGRASRIHFVAAALGAMVGNTTFWVAKNHDKGHFIGTLGSQQDQFDKPPWDATETVVAVDTLDHWFAGLELPSREILYAKIDAQGHDYSVLRGGHGLLASRRIKVLSFEVTPGSEHVEDYLRAVRDLLDFGYTCSDCCPRQGKWAECMRSRPADFSPVDLEDYLIGLAFSKSRFDRTRGTWTNFVCHVRSRQPWAEVRGHLR